jgi:malonyl-CoA decarboxylase
MNMRALLPAPWARLVGLSDRPDALDEAPGLGPRQLTAWRQRWLHVADTSVSEAEGGRRAEQVAAELGALNLRQRAQAWALMSRALQPDAGAIARAQQHYAEQMGRAGQTQAEMALRRALYSPRVRLLQRFNGFATGMQFLVSLRAEIGPMRRVELDLGADLAALDDELEALFSNWFEVGFLQLQRIDWDSPASLLEKLIRYEAVHDIRSWADLKNRLDSDRRCYAFFHPRMPKEPLIFVEVAFTHGLADSVAQLLDEAAPLGDAAQASTAIFYSISNTQAGLKGVSFGDSLIKRVVETLQAEFPKLRQFATLSPIPGLRDWVARSMPASLEAFDAAAEMALATPLDGRSASGQGNPSAHELLQAAARYLCALDAQGRPLDPVARFHLGNGARAERLNWAADPSDKARRQSFGVMVNYLYDTKRLDQHRAQLAKGRVPTGALLNRLR